MVYAFREIHGAYRQIKRQKVRCACLEISTIYQILTKFQWSKASSPQLPRQSNADFKCFILLFYVFPTVSEGCCKQLYLVNSGYVYSVAKFDENCHFYMSWCINFKGTVA
jgi:hypothetical protein